MDLANKKFKGGDAILLSLQDLSAEVSDFGATVLSFQKNGREALFLSDNAVLDGSKPIRGGIPLVFPFFGADPDAMLPSHGFARISKWTVLHREDSKVVLGLTHKDVVWEKHPGMFTLEYTVELLLPASLKTSLRIVNSGGLLHQDEFSFQCLQHTYLKLPCDISRVQIEGVPTEYINQLKGRVPQKRTSSQDPLFIDQEVDHIYFGSHEDEPEVVQVGEIGCPPYFRSQRSFVVAGVSQKCDVVVWNPWVEKSKKMADFGDEEYKEMLCIEPGNVGAAGHCLKGGQDAVLIQVLSFL